MSKHNMSRWVLGMFIIVNIGKYPVVNAGGQGLKAA